LDQKTTNQLFAITKSALSRDALLVWGSFGMPKGREALISAYMAALPLCAIAVAAPLRVRQFVVVEAVQRPADWLAGLAARSKVRMGLACARWCRDASRAEMVLTMAGEQWADQALGAGRYAIPAARAIETINQVASDCCEPDDILDRAQAAAVAAAELVERRFGELAGGGYRSLNREYRIDRLSGSKMPYRSWIEAKKIEAAAAVARGSLPVISRSETLGKRPQPVPADLL